MKWPWIILVVMGAMGAFALGPASRGESRTVRVTSGTMIEAVVGRAEVVPTEGVAEVRAQIDGRVTAVHVREGDVVQAGQLLAEIDGVAAQSEVSRREAERRALAEEVRTVSEGTRREER